uniref:TLDc domain-containing protein n=1 Tax=Entamoeba invadens TaxID=33085 RepID=S0B371_ENTIV|nr:hypothetical protein [Entamoeba invadens]
MEAILNKIIFQCTAFKNKLPDYIRAQNITYIKDREDIPIAERIKVAEENLEHFNDYHAKGEAVKGDLNDLRLDLDALMHELSEEVRKYEDKEGSYNTLIDTLVYLEQKKAQQEKQILQTQIDEIDSTFRVKEKSLETKKKQISINGTLDEEEVSKIKEWSGKNVTNVLFDSNVDDWGTSAVFNRKVVGRKEVVVVVEDMKGNKFGGVIFKTIQAEDLNTADPQAFAFVLKTKGKIKGASKFKILEAHTNYAFGCYKDDHPRLFYITNCIFVMKRGEGGSNCISGITEIPVKTNFWGGVNFTPKRIFVFQLH